MNFLFLALVLTFSSPAFARSHRSPTPTPTRTPTQVPTVVPSPTATPTRTPSPTTTATSGPPPTATPTPTVSAASTTGGWLLKCAYSHSLPDDPIVFPAQPGASHLHDFLGNTTSDANSSYGSMTFNSATTTCPTSTGDTAGYWAPALYKNGVKIDPSGPGVREQFYYRKNNLNAGTVIQSFPPDFRMVTGNMHATTEAENPYLGREIYYGCSDNSASGKPTSPVNCATGIISLHVGFPNCWDGVNLDSPDHKSHVVYPSGGRCPADHPVALPRLIIRLEYPVGPDSSGITLSSGPYYTAHGDFWNTWEQPKLDNLVAQCLNTSTDCGTF